jgi:GTP-binding protein
MKITSTEFLLGAAGPDQLPHTSLKEIAFLGRSNVGKSSLISALCGKPRLARSGKTPGKTRELNYYLINESFHFVDLPGYGYAKLPEQVRTGLGKLIEGYLQDRKNLVCVVQLIDSRHEPTALDMMMVGWLDYYAIPFVVVLSKADKLPRSKLAAYRRDAEKAFSRFHHLRGIVHFSTSSGEGRTELLGILSGFVS